MSKEERRRSSIDASFPLSFNIRRRSGHHMNLPAAIQTDVDNCLKLTGHYDSLKVHGNAGSSGKSNEDEDGQNETHASNQSLTNQSFNLISDASMKDKDDCNKNEVIDVTYMTLEVHDDGQILGGNENHPTKIIEMRRLSHTLSKGHGSRKSSLHEDEGTTKYSALPRDEEDECDDETDSLDKEEEETFWSITVQVFIPFLIAGMGMVGAGLVLDIVQHWAVFSEVSEVFILVPALLGLKGNLEMTLASRLSTQANLGNLDTTKSQWVMTFTNLSLVQCQAIVVGFLASLAAVLLGWIPEGHFDLNHAFILCASSVTTASIASFALGVVMILVIILSRQFKINPDNVATPIAASLGDLTTLSLLACVSNAFYVTIESHQWLCPAVLGLYLISMPFWIYLSKQHKLTKRVLYHGWSPVLSAMLISSFGGLILDFAVKTFTGVAVFQPVINGVGGNLVAVQASRISTHMHKTSHLGRLPHDIGGVCSNPFTVFCDPGGHARTARALTLMVIPGHMIFVYTISYIQAGHTSVTPVFLIFYLLAALIQVVLLLYIAEVLVKHLWVRKIDPDNSAIPYLTALGDLIGTALLAVAFTLLYAIGDKDSDVGD